MSKIKVLSLMNSHSSHSRLDLEHDLGARNPPGRTQLVPKATGYLYPQEILEQVRGKEIPVGGSLAFTHPLQHSECQCRHDLEPDERMSKGITADSMRSGACPLTIKIESRISAFGIGSTYINLTSSGLVDLDMPELVEALSHSRNLSVLLLPGNGIANEGAKSLTTLLKSRNQVGNSGATSIANALADNYTLTSLSLDSNPIRLEGIRALLATMEKNRFCSVTLPDFEAVNRSDHDKGPARTKGEARRAQ